MEEHFYSALQISSIYISRNGDQILTLSPPNKFKIEKVVGKRNKPVTIKWL